MTNTQYQDKLKYLGLYDIQKKVKMLIDYDIEEERKIKFVENLYKLANMSYDLYIKDGQAFINK